MRQHKATTKTSYGRIPSATDQAEMPIERLDGMRDSISRKAYELWEQRGCQEGTTLRD